MWLKRTSRKELVVGENGYGLRYSAKTTGLFTFLATGTNSTYGTWTANNGSTISGSTFNVLTNIASRGYSINHSESVSSSRYQGLTIDFGSTTSAVDCFGFAIGDFGSTTANTVPIDNNENVSAHCVLFVFNSGVIRVKRPNNTVVTQVSVASIGTYNWRIVYNGSDINNMTMSVFRNGSLVMTSAAFALPSNGRFMWIGRCGGSPGTASVTNANFTLRGI